MSAPDVTANPENTSSVPAIASESKPPENEDKPPPPNNAENTSSVFSNEAYVCDRQYAIVLAQLIALKDREKVYKWIER